MKIQSLLLLVLVGYAPVVFAEKVCAPAGPCTITTPEGKAICYGSSEYPSRCEILDPDGHKVGYWTPETGAIRLVQSSAPGANGN